MKKNRMDRIVALMRAQAVDQLLISDPANIFYLTGRWIHPGERFLGLYLNIKGRAILFNNELFPIAEDLGLEMEWYNDTEQPTDKLVSYLEDGVLGVDKNLIAKFLLKLMDCPKKLKFVNGSLIVDSVRMIKDEKEKQFMREASILNDKAVDMLKTKLYEGMTEKQAVSVLQSIYEDLGADGFSFDPIIGFGINAADPHHEVDNTKLKKGDSVILDIGCKKDDYCSDMTRTVFFDHAPEKGVEIYNIVKEAQTRALASIKPGVRFCDVDSAARGYIEEKGYGKYFTHRTGHSIGIEVHEYGDVSAINQDPLEAGMIFSVEPGIYLTGNVGVRIEDLVIVTTDGYENLNKASKELEIVK